MLTIFSDHVKVKIKVLILEVLWEILVLSPPLSLEGQKCLRIITLAISHFVCYYLTRLNGAALQNIIKCVNLTYCADGSLCNPAIKPVLSRGRLYFLLP